MSDQFFKQPVLNSPYGYPSLHWELDEKGQPTQQIVESRRASSFISPIPKPRRHHGEQATLALDEVENLSDDGQRYRHSKLINSVRREVDAWRRLPPAQWRVTPETARLLEHWRNHKFAGVRPFFCQVEAAETAIWLTEVAPQLGKNGESFLDHLKKASNDANPGLMRLALKLATGAGKTTVMAMLIAWQTVNAVRHPQSKKFTRGFLLVAPGLTIKDRLRVLLPNDADSYYASREIVPRDMLADLDKAKIVITNYHAFKLRERMELSKGGRRLLQGRTGSELDTLETEGQMLQRVMPDLMGLKNILAINDEAHHCYREKPNAVEDDDLDKDQKAEAEENNEAARLREALNKTLGKQWQEWEIPREADAKWSDEAKKLHVDWWQQRIARQKEIDASIAAKAEFEYLYDKPYEDKKKVRVAGPFTVESLSPHRVLGVDEEDELIDHVAETQAEYGQDFASLILANLRTAGVQQAHKADKIEFTSLEPWPGDLICAEGRYLENGQVKRAGILVGPEFGTVTRADLVDAAREAGDANFDVLIACAFNYDAPASEFSKLGRINVLKARMNADLHMAEDLKNTGKGNLFVIFGEPDVDVLDTQGRSIRRYDGKRDVIDVPTDGQLMVKINGVDVFHPSTGEVRSDGADGIACWFLDTDYNEESFFVRHAYFLGANDPYKALKTTLKAEIDPDVWATLNSDTSRPFPKPSNGRFAVKVINHLGDEVMKVFRV